MSNSELADLLDLLAIYPEDDAEADAFYAKVFAEASEKLGEEFSDHGKLITALRNK